MISHMKMTRAGHKEKEMDKEVGLAGKDIGVDMVTVKMANSEALSQIHRARDLGICILNNHSN